MICVPQFIEFLHLLFDNATPDNPEAIPDWARDFMMRMGRLARSELSMLHEALVPSTAHGMGDTEALANLQGMRHSLKRGRSPAASPEKPSPNSMVCARYGPDLVNLIRRTRSVAAQLSSADMEADALFESQTQEALQASLEMAVEDDDDVDVDALAASVRGSQPFESGDGAGSSADPM